MEQPKKEICSIRIMFPVENDEQAIDCKKKVEAVLVDIPETQVHFTLMSSPSGSVNVPQIR